MATKTISLKLEAYERPRRARRTPAESFSEVVVRAQWPEMGMTAGELASGPRLQERKPWQALVGGFKVLTPDLDSA